MRIMLPVIFLSATVLTNQIFGGESTNPGLKKATIEQMIGDVKLKKAGDNEDRKALLKEAVTGSDIIRTGKKSRAELEFPDGSISRLGSNTIFSFDPNTRDMAFTRGVALVHVPPGKGGARIATPAATAAIQGDTICVRATVMPDGTPATQFTALSPVGGPTDGNIRVTLNSNPGVSFQLPAGQVAIVPQNATSLAQIPRVEIDVGTFVKNSPLMQNLTGTAKLETSMVTADQGRAFASGAAQRTEYAIVGDKVVKADANGNFKPPPQVTPVNDTTTASPREGPLPPGATRMTDGSVKMADGTVVNPDGTAVRPDGTVVQMRDPAAGGTMGKESMPPGATRMVDGTVRMPDGSTMSPNGTMTRADGTTMATGTYAPPGGTQPAGSTGMPPTGTYSLMSPTFSSAVGIPATSFFNPSSSFTFTAYMPPPGVLSGGAPPPGAPPPGFVFTGTTPITLNTAYTFNTSVGTISGITANFAFDGGRFSFDRLTLAGATISVEGANPLILSGWANSGTPGTGNAIAVSGVNTFAFAAGTPTVVSLEAIRGDVQINGKIDTTVASTGINGGKAGDVTVMAANGAVALGSSAQILAAGAAASTGIGGIGGKVEIRAATTITSSSSVTSGTINTSGGNSSGTVGGAAGNIMLTANSSTCPAINLTNTTDVPILVAVGGNGTGSATGGAGGRIEINAPTCGAASITGQSSGGIAEVNALGGTGTSAGSNGTINTGSTTVTYTTANQTP